MKSVIKAAAVCVIGLAQGAWGKIEVDCAYPGGNAVVLGVDEAAGVVQVRPDQRDTMGGWFWSDFRVRGAQGRKLKFDFGKGHWSVGALGHAVSEDGGESWRFTSPGGNEARDSFEYEFGAGAKEVRFALAIPYLEKDWKKFAARALAGREGDGVEQGTLCVSRKGKRNVELLTLKPRGAGAGWLFAFTARHHCCEVTANPVMEGMIEFALGGSEEAKWLRENAEAVFVPFMDKDGCEDGDQGKNRRPHDYNRDYIKGLYPEVRAFKRLVEDRSKGRKVVFVDLHAPWLRGSKNDPEHNHAFLLVPAGGEPYAGRWERVRGLLKKFQDGSNGGIKYDGEHDIPWGVRYNSPKSYTGTGLLMSSTMWGMGLPNVHNSFCMEIGYSLCGGAVYSFERGRELGRSLMRALVIEAKGAK